MSVSDSIRERKEQHKPKNAVSKNEDKKVAEASEKVMTYIERRFKDYFDGSKSTNGEELSLAYEKAISIGDMIKFIDRRGIRQSNTFNHDYDLKKMEPDGGVIYLIKSKNENDETTIIEKLPLVITEVKHQGTNDKRIKEGLPMQAYGNAIERLGKNLVGIRAMMHYENITPFICFGDGCDFASVPEIYDIIDSLDIRDEDEKEKLTQRFMNGSRTVLAKAFTLNEFYELNKLFIFKQDKHNDSGPYAPVSMMFRNKEWTVDEMYEQMREIAETSFRYYMF